MDSEGVLTAYYSEAPLEQVIGKIPSGPEGPAGENGKIVDVIVNGESVVTSEGIAYITASSEGVVYTAGENIDITGNVISAIDTKYTAGDNIEISADNVISSPMLIDKVITVTEDVGGYVTGDTITADTPIRQIIETILAPAPRPVPPQENLFFWGVWGSRTSGPPTGIDSTFASEAIEPAVIQRDGIIKYFTTVKQYECIAFPADMPDLVSVYQNDLPFNVLNGFTKITCEYNGVQYKLYYNQLTQETNSKYQFMWR